MAAISLTGAKYSGDSYTATGVGITWQEFTLAEWARRVTITAENGDAYVGWAEMGAGTEAPADAGAVGTHRDPIYARTPAEFRRRMGSRTRSSGSVFIAGAQAGLVVTIKQEE